MNDLQRTEEWYKQRIGHLTASMAKDLIRYQKGGITLQTDVKITNRKNTPLTPMRSKQDQSC